MITMSHGESWRTPVSSDPPPSKTHHNSPGHTPRPRSPIYKLVGAASDRSARPAAGERISGIYRPQILMFLRGSPAKIGDDKCRFLLVILQGRLGRLICGGIGSTRGSERLVKNGDAFEPESSTTSSLFGQF